MKSVDYYVELWESGQASAADIITLVRDEQALYLRTQGTNEDFKIQEIDGVDGTNESMSWNVYTEVENANG